MKNSTNSVIADYERRVRFFDRMEDVCSAIVGAASVFFLVGALTLKNVFVSAFGQNAVIAALVLFSAPLILGMQGACASISRRNHWHAEGEKEKVRQKWQRSPLSKTKTTAMCHRIDNATARGKRYAEPAHFDIILNTGTDESRRLLHAAIERNRDRLYAR